MSPTSSRSPRPAPASVTNMFGRLREMGLVEYERYHGASLTEAGRVEALRLRTLLIGAAAPQEDRQRVHETIAAFKEVNEILRLLTMHLGPNAVLVNAEIHVVDGLNTDQIEELIEQITRAIREEVPEADQIFIELRPPKQPGPE